MIETRSRASVEAHRLRPLDARRLVATDYSRQMITAALTESFVEAFKVRAGELSVADREWVRQWLQKTVGELTEWTVDALATAVDTALATAPPRLLERLDDRGRRARLGIE